MKPLLTIFTLVFTVIFPSLSYAETPFSLMRGGYSLIYEGYAVVKKCVPNEPFKVGPYIVKCNSYSYPYHYGNVLLFARSFAYEGRKILLGYLCLDEDDDDCESLLGIYRR